MSILKWIYNVKQVSFKDGSYGIRRTILGVKTYAMTLWDNPEEGSIYFVPPTDPWFRHARMREEEARKMWNRLYENPEA